MAIVDGLISALTEEAVNIISNQVHHALDFNNQFEEMKDRLSEIKALLGDRSNNRNNEVVQTTLAEFRNLMYEADDILTDCLVREEYHKNHFWFRYRTCKKMKDINIRMKNKADILGNHLRATQVESYYEEEDSARTTTEDCPYIVGRDKDVEYIKDWIFSAGEKILKIGIVGMGGLGKTTIAKKIFNDEAVRKHFDQKIWVCVSQSYRVETVLKSILRRSGEESGSSEQSSGDTSQLLFKVISLLRERSCLIVLDDIWENRLQWWKDCFFPQLPESDCKKSCIIITTRDKDVASSIGVDRNHEPDGLSKSESWSLFSKHAFAKIEEEIGKFGKERNETEVETRRKKLLEFKQVGEEIVPKCGGLPLAIKTIGGLLGSKISSLDEWKEIGNNFLGPNLTDGNATVRTSLRLSYDALPSNLKQCLLCFSVYPQDVEIQAEKLIHWWVGEGLIQETELKTATEVGFEHLLKLVSRCLVEVIERRGYDGRVYSCKMHDLVRDLTLMMAKEEGICSFDKERKQELTKESRWVGFTSEMKANSLTRSPKLRGLLQMTSDQAPYDRILGSFYSLRVLDLSDNKLDNNALKNLVDWISSLKRLAYLNLSGSKKLEEVPSSIGKLRNLQLLVLSGCPKLTKVSPSIIYLKKLIVLDLWSCDQLQYVPRGLGMLHQLQELSGLRVTSKSNKRSCSILELGELSKLRVLRIQLSKDSDVTKEEWDVLAKLKKLKIFAIDFDTEKFEGAKMQEMLEQVSPPPGLKELHIRRYQHQALPKWVSPENLKNLVYLRIEDGGIDDLQRSETEDWNLEGLSLKLLPWFRKDWKDLKDKMPFLRYAEIKHCPEITNFPETKDYETGIWRQNQN